MSNSDNGATAALFIKSLDVASRIAMPFLLGACGWIFSQLWSHEGRLIQMESTRFTTQDAQSYITPISNVVSALDGSMDSLHLTQALMQQQLVNIDNSLSVLSKEVESMKNNGN